MKIEIKTGVATVGMLKKTKVQEVNLFVELTEEEKAIIREFDLGSYVIMERNSPATSDSNIPYNLTFRHLVEGSDKYNLHLPINAKNYVENLVERLKWAKGYLVANSTQAEGVSLEI